jgi:hypothetical protein
MKKAILFIGLASIIMCLTPGVEAQQGQNMTLIARKAVILFVQGDVMMKNDRTIKWLDATTGTTLKQGDSLKTGRNSWAEIGVVTEFENVVRVRESTLVKLIDLRPIRISLLDGEVRSLVEGLERGSTFEIETPTAVCGARGTGWDTRTDGKSVEVDAYEKKVYFKPLKKGIKKKTIRAGKSGVLDPSAKDIKISKLSKEKIKKWKRWKKDFHERRSENKDKGAAKSRVQNIQQKAKKVETAQKSIEDIAKSQDSKLDRKDSASIDKRTKKCSDEY